MNTITISTTINGFRQALEITEVEDSMTVYTNPEINAFGYKDHDGDISNYPFRLGCYTVRKEDSIFNLDTDIDGMVAYFTCVREERDGRVIVFTRYEDDHYSQCRVLYNRAEYEEAIELQKEASLNQYANLKKLFLERGVEEDDVEKYIRAYPEGDVAFNAKYRGAIIDDSELTATWGEEASIANFNEVWVSIKKLYAHAAAPCCYQIKLHMKNYEAGEWKTLYMEPSLFVDRLKDNT